MLKKNESKKLRKLIKQIKETRRRNNQDWMRLLELSVIYAPEETLDALAGIEENDAKIGEDFSSLVKELRRVVGDEK